jgi:hypothetical protein
MGETIVIIASGPSLKPAEVARVKTARDAGQCRVCVINTTYQRAPWADFLYACDDNWWTDNKPTFAGERWTQSPQAAQYGARRCPGKAGYIISTNPEFIYFGGNSGFQAINLAFLMGAARIVLVGFDMDATGGKLHWHADHAGRCHNPPMSQFKRWREVVDNAAKQLLDMGVNVVNCTGTTALVDWPRATLDEVFCDRTI